MVRTLIVDDQPAFRSFARSLLAAQGINVVGEAEDGAAALAAVRELLPELVVLDIQLPDATGFEVAARLAAEPSAPAVILVSVRGEEDYGPLLRSAYVLGFITKAELSASRIMALIGDAP